MPEHRIRLNRAWEVRATPLEFSLSADAPQLQTPVDERFDLPLEVDGDEPTGDDGMPARLVLTRWFNGPSNLVAGQLVQIAISPSELLEDVLFNGELLVGSHWRDASATDAGATDAGATDAGATDAGTILDLTDKLQRHNRLDILVAHPAALSQASVALVIHDAT